MSFPYPLASSLQWCIPLLKTPDLVDTFQQQVKVVGSVVSQAQNIETLSLAPHFCCQICAASQQ